MSVLNIAALTLSLVSVVIGSGLRTAPYYMPLDNNGEAIDIAAVMKETGVKQFILAFALATNDGKCIPTWDGNPKQKVIKNNK